MKRVVSLFSGIGAPEKALENLGVDYDLVAYSEIDKYASRSYAAIHNVSEDLNLGDITKIYDLDNITDIDLLAYGFPCQDISSAGHQKGLLNEDCSLTRSGLFFEALRIIETVRPRIAIAENVKNLVSKKFAGQFKLVLESLEQAGYNNYWKVLNAKNFDVPQNRERVFIVSIRKDIDTKTFKFPDEMEPCCSLKQILEREVEKRFYLNQEQIAKVKIKNNDALLYDCSMLGYETNAREYNDSSPTLTAREYKEPRLVNETALKDMPKQIAQLYGTDVEPNPSGGRVYDVNHPMRTLGAGNGMSKPYIGMDNGEGLVIRKMVPIECWRLMGFSDDDFYKAQAINSNTQLYKQAGNSIVVNVLEHIYKELINAGLLEMADHSSCDIGSQNVPTDFEADMCGD